MNVWLIFLQLEVTDLEIYRQTYVCKSGHERTNGHMEQEKAGNEKENGEIRVDRKKGHEGQFDVKGGE